MQQPVKASLAELLDSEPLTSIVETLALLCEEKAERERQHDDRRSAVNWEHDAKILYLAPIRNGAKRWC